MAPAKGKTKRYPLIPEEEEKCIWMTTGFISYKLCDRRYQCETCPLDQAIKNEERAESALQEEPESGMEELPKGDSFSQINGSIFYHPDHCWVQVENPEKVKIGIDDLLAQLMIHVRVVILPQVGSFFGQGECCAHIIQDDYILPVASPLSGSIQAVNPRLKKEPELISTHPRDDGWLIIMKPGGLENDLKKLLFGRKALLWYLREEKEIIAQTSLVLNHRSQAVGPTMQDGGVRIESLQEMLNAVSPKQRIQILDSSIRNTRHSKLNR